MPSGGRLPRLGGPKYETGDDRSYALAEHLIASEFEPLADERG